MCADHCGMEAAEAAATAADTVTTVGTGVTDPRTKGAQSEQHTELAPFRTPVVIARGLAEGLAIAPQAALRLVRHLIAAGIAREATGRAAWRAFTTA